ncbi:hypothetical protein C8A03DRAFT_33323 [Achaetomium macrosporum]|uniref:Uncharacterized protein n=1 Tax=Achaetomium macrosporum TaxID=79813 RepID=A0AAN7CCS9_9PEZI|nr:hypothetical protein C8A03DRAFT_33323 [Achaetomium macrosporum]
MPHSVREQTGTEDLHRRDDKLNPPPSALAEDATQQQSPMLKAWSDELDPRNLTINEALLLNGLTGGRTEAQDAGGRQEADAARSSEQRV